MNDKERIYLSIISQAYSEQVLKDCPLFLSRYEHKPRPGDLVLEVTSRSPVSGQLGWFVNETQDKVALREIGTTKLITWSNCSFVTVNPKAFHPDQLLDGPKRVFKTQAAKAASRLPWEYRYGGIEWDGRTANIWIRPVFRHIAWFWVSVDWKRRWSIKRLEALLRSAATAEPEEVTSPVNDSVSWCANLTKDLQG